MLKLLVVVLLIVILVLFAMPATSADPTAAVTQRLFCTF